jgi:hypothetical protein
MRTTYPVPESRITFNPGTHLYGLSVRFSGRPPHFEMDEFETLDRAMAWVDPWKERIWAEPSDADESCPLVSQAVTEEAFEKFYVRRW